MAEPAAAPETKPRKSARAKIEVEGDVDPSKVGDVLDAASSRRKDGPKDPEMAAAQKFARAIRNPAYRITATRSQPQTMRDGTPLGDTMDLAPHEALTEEEIKRDISEARGGRKWIVRVYNEGDTIVSSRALEIRGEPKLDPMELGGAELEPEGGGGRMEGEMSEVELLEEHLAKDPDIIKAKKKLALMRLENEEEEEKAKQAEVRARRAAAEREAKGEAEAHRGNGNGKHADDDENSKLLKAIEAANGPLKEANAALQRRLDDAEKRNSEKELKAEQQRMIEAQTAPLKQMLEEQRQQTQTILAKLNAPPVQTGPTTDAILQKLDLMKSDIKNDTKDQILAVVNQLTSKIDTVATTLNTYMTKSNDPATTALISLATAGGKGGAAPVDPYAGLERALKALQSLKTVAGMDQTSTTPPDFPSFLVDKMAEMTPEVLNFFREQRGAIPTKEEMEQKMRDAAMKMYTTLDESMKKELNAGFQRLAQRGQAAPTVAAVVPAPVPAPPGPGAAPVTVGQGGTAPAPTVVSFPGGPPGPGAAPAPAPAPAPASDVVLTPTQLWAQLTEQDRVEYAKRVNWILTGMLHEMKLGIREMKWPEKAHGNLPKPLIEQIAEAKNDTDVHDAVKPYADPALLSAIWGYLGPSNPQHEWYQDWLATGINWIKKAEGYEFEEEPPVTEDQPQ
jgi:hypothetical protein